MGRGPLGIPPSTGKQRGESGVDPLYIYDFPMETRTGTPDHLFSDSRLTGHTPGHATSHPSDSVTLLGCQLHFQPLPVRLVKGSERL